MLAVSFVQLAAKRCLNSFRWLATLAGVCFAFLILTQETAHNVNIRRNRKNVQSERNSGQHRKLYEHVKKAGLSEIALRGLARRGREAGLSTERRVLIVSGTANSTRMSQNVLLTLETYRIESDRFIVGKDKQLPTLRRSPLLGRYALVVFDDVALYILSKRRDKWRSALDRYCAEFWAGQILFSGSLTARLGVTVGKRLPMEVHSLSGMTHAQLNAKSDLLRIGRDGGVWQLSERQLDSVTLSFVAYHISYQPVEFMWSEKTPMKQRVKKVTVLYDTGRYDGIRRVFFGRGLYLWMHKLLLLDAFYRLSPPNLVPKLADFGFTRRLAVDIDDVFGTQESQHMMPEDVKALVQLQEDLSKSIAHFRFTLGFVASKFSQGSEKENQADKELMKKKEHFVWFDHIYQHDESRWYKSLSELEAEMRKSQAFAKRHQLPIVDGYAVAPRHSGVYPVHPLLFQAWKNVWNVTVTTTEEYPHLQPARLRRGFVFNGTRVLPRQTCGLFTTTNYLETFPGGEERLKTYIEGGELFLVVLRNPVSIFMTHANNYSGDRLAQLIFTRLLSFVKRWTKLSLEWRPHDKLAQIYFKYFPKDTEPLWEAPCSDKRHLLIWSRKAIDCRRLPSLLLLSLPSAQSWLSTVSNILQEEKGIMLAQRTTGGRQSSAKPTEWNLRFFSDNNIYGQSVEWYLDRLPAPSPEGHVIETSTEYLSAPLAAKRAAKLLPNAQLVVFAHEPWLAMASCLLARSSSNNVRSQSLTFVSAAIRSGVFNRCAEGVNVSRHLQWWLDAYPNHMISVVDIHHVQLQPAETVQRILQQLGLTLDARTKHIKWNLGSTLAPDQCQISQQKEQSDTTNFADGNSLLKCYNLPQLNERVKKLASEVEHHPAVQELTIKLAELLNRERRLKRLGMFQWLLQREQFSN